MSKLNLSNFCLYIFQILDAENVLVVVSRWYGGIHLGPDRFKHINNCTRSILEQTGHIKEKVNMFLQHKALFFLILGLRIFFQNIKVAGGKKIKIKITKIFFFI